MLRLQFPGHAPANGEAPELRARQSSLVVRITSVKCPLGRHHAVKALKDKGGRGGASGGFAGQSWDPGLEIEVPFEQRPVNEYSSLKSSLLYSWGELSPGSFLLRLGGLWLVTFTVLGAPIAAASFNPSKDPIRFALAAGIGTLLLVSIVVLRIYLVSSSLYLKSIDNNKQDGVPILIIMSSESRRLTCLDVGSMKSCFVVVYSKDLISCNHRPFT